MPRPKPDIEPVQISLKLRPEVLRKLDDDRGTTSRPDWISDLIMDERPGGSPVEPPPPPAPVPPRTEVAPARRRFGLTLPRLKGYHPVTNEALYEEADAAPSKGPKK